MTLKAKGTLFRNKEGKCYLYIPKALAGDSMFPFKKDSQKVYVHVNTTQNLLIIQEVKKESV